MRCTLVVDTRKQMAYIHAIVIRSFRSKALAALWSSGASSKIDSRMHVRLLRRLDVLNQADRPEDMNVPGFDFHALRSLVPTRYSVHVNGPWCMTFAFADGDAIDVDFEQYH